MNLPIIELESSEILLKLLLLNDQLIFWATVYKHVNNVKKLSPKVKLLYRKNL